MHNKLDDDLLAMEGKVIAGFDLSFTMAAGVWLNSKFEIVDQKCSPIKPGPLRLKRAFHLFYSWLKVPPNLVIIEDNAYGAPSRHVVVKLSQLNTLVKTICECQDIAWLEVAPSALKKEITGKGNAEKNQVAEQIDKLYGIRFTNDKGFDLSDACAAAIWGVKHLKRGIG